MSDTLIHVDPSQLAPADAALMAAMYAKLQEHYPGHHWRTTADHEQGVAAVYLQYLDAIKRTAGRYGYALLIDKLKSDPDMRSVVRAGGELLERFGLPRHRYPVDHETRLRALEHGLDLTR